MNIFFLTKPKTTKPPIMNSQNQLQSQNQNVPQHTSQSVFFNNQPRATVDHSERPTIGHYPFFK